nr:atherin-like [Manis javanica]
MPVKWGHQHVPPGLPAGRDAYPYYWLAFPPACAPPTRPRVYTTPARTEQTLRSPSHPACHPHPHPHYGRRAALGPGSRAAPPPPRAGAPPAFRRGCGSRKPRASRSELQRPVAPQTTPPTQPDNAAGPRGGRAAPGPNLGPSTWTGRTVWIGARETMGTRAGPAVAGQREPRV